MSTRCGGLEEKHPLCAEAPASVGTDSWLKHVVGAGKQAGRVQLLKRYPRAASVHGFPPSRPPTQIVTSLKRAAAGGKRRFLMPFATFLSSQTSLPSSQTGSPLSSQDPFSHENFPHGGGGPACGSSGLSQGVALELGDEEMNRGRNHSRLRLPLPLLSGPHRHVPKRGPAQALLQEIGNSQVDLASEPVHLVLVLGPSLPPPHRRGEMPASSFRTNKKEEHFLYCTLPQT